MHARNVPVPGFTQAGTRQRKSHGFCNAHGILLPVKAIHNGGFPRGKIQLLTKRREKGQVNQHRAHVCSGEERPGWDPEGPVSLIHSEARRPLSPLSHLGCWEPLKVLEGAQARW